MIKDNLSLYFYILFEKEYSLNKADVEYFIVLTLAAANRRASQS